VTSSPVAPKVLFIDIETTPNLAHVWGLWQQNVGLPQLLEATEMLCFAAKWQGKDRIHFYSQQFNGRDKMVKAAHDLLDQADIIVHYNGRSFDVPHLNREFLLAGLNPPAPYQQVDLLETVKRRFRFPSNKLAYVSEALNLGGKVKHDGHELWVRCMAGNRDAWATMRAYNLGDITLLEDVYDALYAWIPNHPTVTLFGASNGSSCPGCGGTNLQKRGYSYTKVSTYQRFQCNDCGKFSRSGKRTSGVDLREVS
jgi:uncharacterized protein YprB with RNaseH-like and TPR domain